MRILQSLLPKLGGDQACKHKRNPSANTSAKQAAWLHRCKRKCKPGVNTKATQVQTQWQRHAETCKHAYTPCKRKCKHKCNRRDNPQLQVQVQASVQCMSRPQTCHRFFPQQIPPHETTRSSWVKHMGHPQDHNIALSGNWVKSQQHGHTAGVRGCPTAVILGVTS